jgi:hypothetical protein
MRTVNPNTNRGWKVDFRLTQDLRPKLPRARKKAIFDFQPREVIAKNLPL